MALTLVACVGFGAITATAIVGFGADAIAATLGMLTALRGLAWALIGGQAVFAFHPGLFGVVDDERLRPAAFLPDRASP